MEPAGAFERAEAEKPANYGFTWTEMDLRTQADNHRALETELGDAAFASARDEGMRLSTDQVVKVALGRLKPADLGTGGIPGQS